MIILPYFVGSAITVVVLFILSKILNKKKKRIEIVVTQSLMYRALKKFITFEEPIKKLKTQASEYEKSQYIPVVLVDNQAYWIMDNALFVADQINGTIDKDSARTVDTMGMDKVQLDKTIYIVDTLTEGAKNDNRDSRN